MAGGAPRHFAGGWPNPFLTEFGIEYGFPAAATRGGAATMYPEFQKTLDAR
jgi:hypothetical protein